MPFYIHIGPSTAPALSALHTDRGVNNGRLPTEFGSRSEICPKKCLIPISEGISKVNQMLVEPDDQELIYDSKHNST